VLGSHTTFPFRYVGIAPHSLGAPHDAFQAPLKLAPFVSKAIRLDCNGSMGKFLAAEQSSTTIAYRGWAESLWVEMRPRQWVTNLFVLVPLLFSQNLFTLAAVGRACAAFILFCLISSSVYLLNDIKDCKQDRSHPQKRHRPLAAGELNLGIVWGVMVV